MKNAHTRKHINVDVLWLTILLGFVYLYAMTISTFSRLVEVLGE